MRVMVLTTWYPSVDDPVKAVFVQRHAEALALRHEVLVIKVAPADAPPPPPSVAGLSVHHVVGAPRNPMDLARARVEIGTWREKFQPEVVHTMGFSSLALGALGHRSTPWVHTEHWSGVARPESAGFAWSAMRSTRHVLRLPDAVTVVSSDMAERVEPFIRSGRLHVVANVVTGPATPPNRPQVEAFRLFGLGALVPVKCPVLAVETVAWLRDKGVDVSLRWAGAGPLQEQMREAIERLRLEEHVTLLGRVAPADLAQHFAWSTEFLLPTQHETFCVAAGEALAHGRPVVLGAVGGQRDFVDEQVGTLVAERAPAAYGEALLDVRERLGGLPPAAFAERVISRFGPEAIAARFDEVYGSTAG